MEVRLNIGLNQIVGLIKELPYNDKLVIRNQLEKEFNSKTSDKNTLKQLLLAGPTMTEEGYKNYKDNRKQFNKWTKKLSA